MAKDLHECFESVATFHTTTGPKNLKEMVERDPEHPDYFVLDPNIVKRDFERLQQALPWATPYIATKANSSSGLLDLLRDMGSNFEIATRGELQLCIDKGIDGSRILYSHPAKTTDGIREALKHGVRRFVTDSVMDMNVIAEQGERLGIDTSQVQLLVRIGTNNHRGEHDDKTGFDKRFGLDEASALTLLQNIHDRGMTPLGVSMHTGTQQENVHAWDAAIAVSARIFRAAKESGIPLSALNIGGGFPSHYKKSIPSPEYYGKAIGSAFCREFGDNLPEEVFMEPGRSISAMDGMTIGRVVNCKPHPQKREGSQVVTLTTGRYNAGLYGVGHGVFFYSRDTDGTLTLNVSDTVPTDSYGRACASFDTPIDGGHPMPRNLKPNDIVVVTGSGCYTQHMSTHWCSAPQPQEVRVELKEPVRPLNIDRN